MRRIALLFVALLAGACARPAEPLLEPVRAEFDGEIVSIERDGAGALWLLVDHGDDSGALHRLLEDRQGTDLSLDVTLSPTDATWFVGGWVVVGSDGPDAAFRRVQADGSSFDGGEPFAGRFTAVAASEDRAVMVGVEAGEAVAVDVDSTGSFTATWSDLQGVRVSAVALQGAEVVLAMEQRVGGSQILRRGPEVDTRTQISLVVETLCMLPDASAYVGGATVAPTERLPAYAWLGADLSVSQVVLPAQGGRGVISASAAWPAGGVVRAERGGVERADQDVAIAIVQPDDGVSPPSRWAQPLGGTDARVSDLIVQDDVVVVVGEADGGPAWWLVRPPAQGE